jgi:hypothetical protein
MTVRITNTRNNDIQHNNKKCDYQQNGTRYAELSVIMLSVIMLNVVVQSVVGPSCWWINDAIEFLGLGIELDRIK